MSKKETGLFAFWKYDKFPYMLGGAVAEVLPYGKVYIKSYSGSFTPEFILTHEAGERLLTQLQGLKRCYEAEHAAVNLSFASKLQDLVARRGEIE